MRARRGLRTGIAGGLAVLLATWVPGASASAGDVVGHRDLAAVAARYQRACRSPGAGIGVRTRDGARAFGRAGVLAPGVALRRRSQFLAGSVTKLFVAVVAYQLVASGRLTLETTVERYLPSWPHGDAITVGMLLGHRSGMGDFANDFGPELQALVLADLERRFTYAEVLDLVRAVRPVAVPGDEYHYSNANTIVLGAILQRITHRSLGDMMRSRVIMPLGLDHTIYGPDDLRAAAAVTFHGLFDIAGNGNPIDIGTLPRTAALTVDPAGAGLFSNVPDLLTFTSALFDSRALLPRALLPRALRAALMRTVSTVDAEDLLLGRRFRVVGHGGVSPGAQVIVAFDTRSRATVVAWCNRLDPGPDELLPSVLATKEAFELLARGLAVVPRTHREAR